MSPQAIQEPFSLTKGDGDVTGTTGVVASTAYCTIWSYHVPTGIGLVVLPGHTFSLYIAGTDTFEMPATTLVKIVIWDSSKQDQKTILGPVMYQSLKEFTDRDKIARFNISAPVKVYEKQYLEILTAGADVATTGGVVLATSYFDAEISRVRSPLA
jgi:hypothetical protein